MAQSDKKAQQSVDQAKDFVIESIGETMDLYGVTRSIGNLYGTMYFEDSMTLDEMREKLQMSKPSMSTGVKKLQEYDIVKQSFRRGSRKQTFVAEKNFFNFFNKFFTKKLEREYTLNLSAIAESQPILEDVMNDEGVSEEIREEAREIYDQLENSKAYFHWLEQLVEGIRNGKIFECFPPPENHHHQE
ncbi:choline uptake/conversion transcriptional regulator CudC [Alkalibacillus almallahensis]|uniref:choline uptake/conversion transcriptional regulator CudC n=1 Tax=Alkalibacillus almallahensis TaxID=1379154 RepID=UPI0014228D9B|nr:GbsR/MarR family transcriptional regulator [Alkalibacillus almallahensis]NIK11455.1 DNA-binding transcriptional regulator GbsR (MarR family) [Alkalibacillus almallahensis]